jgi:hypothetical protein
MRIDPLLLRAIELARKGEFMLARDILHDYQSHSYDEDTQLTYTWRRVEQYETEAYAKD